MHEPTAVEAKLENQVRSLARRPKTRRARFRAPNDLWLMCEWLVRRTKGGNKLEDDEVSDEDDDDADERKVHPGPDKLDATTTRKRAAH